MSTGERIYVQELTEMIEHLSSTNKQLIDALGSAFLLIEDKPISDRTHREEKVYHKIKIALRNAGVNEEEP